MAGGVMIVLVLGLQAAAPAAADPAELIRHYRDLTRIAPDRASCETAHGTDITVCGKRHSDQRLPLADEQGPMLGDPRPPGEANADCVARTGGACPVCPPGGCTGVNLLAVPFKLFRVVRAVVDPDH